MTRATGGFWRIPWLLISLFSAWSLCLGCLKAEKPKEDSGTQRHAYPIQGILPAKVALELSHEVKMGDEADLICTVTPSVDVPQMKVFFRFARGVEHVSGDSVVYTSAKKGETKLLNVSECETVGMLLLSG